MAVIENIILPIHFYQTTVVVSAKIHRFFGRFVRVNVFVAVGNNHAAVLKTTVRPVADSITQFIHMHGRINEIIPAAKFTD